MTAVNVILLAFLAMAVLFFAFIGCFFILIWRACELTSVMAFAEAIVFGRSSSRKIDKPAPHADIGPSDVQRMRSFFRAIGVHWEFEIDAQGLIFWEGQGCGRAEIICAVSGDGRQNFIAVHLEPQANARLWTELRAGLPNEAHWPFLRDLAIEIIQIHSHAV